ncbi:MAG: GH92 family glycosyl hydrolase [Candidatus Latescibacterota bacterium]|nr:GH92 family glycosyl hydrolase [Candidatus Latescibacterota bacterium]
MGRLTDYADPEQGSDSVNEFSRGNTSPWIAAPFGMTHWAPQTEEGPRFYKSTARQLQGIRATHQPSPWIGDYGHFLVMPQVGARLFGTRRQSSVFRRRDTTIRPYLFQTFLGRYQTGLAMTATERCACFSFQFPADRAGRILIQGLEGDSWFSVDGRRIEGFTRGNSGGVPDGFACYIYAEVDTDVSGSCLYVGDDVYRGNGESEQIGVSVDLESGGQATLRIATSFISVAQAKRNFDLEVAGPSFEALRDSNEAIWEERLERIQIKGATDRQRRTFYSCLYRTQLFPRVWHEPDQSGNPIHYSPYDGRVHEGVLYADNGFWDTHRTVYSLLSILDPQRLSEMIEGWTNAAKEGGWFPKWSSPGYRACMIGTHLDAVVADAFVKGCRDFDVEAAYAAMLRDATEVGNEDGSFGRAGIDAFDRLGYVPADEFEHAASRTMDHAYTDFCVAQVARGLGRQEDAARFYDRALNYRNTFDVGTGFARGRLRDGSFVEPFDEFAWGGAYIEGSAWQCTWAVPHDPAGMAELMGGRQATIAKLDRMLELPPVFDVGNYGREIHEMTEMAAVDFGQYAHSNQPVHHVLYLYTALGEPSKTQYWVRRVLNELYKPGPADGFAGDEDNGEMTAWYIFSALGLYPLCPGHSIYALGAPLFEKATIQPRGGEAFVIEGRGNRGSTSYAQQIELDGRPLSRLFVEQEEITRGGTLAFEMTEEAGHRTYESADLPFSLSRLSGGKRNR